MTVLAMALHKGGVGKTMSVATLGVALAQRGQRVLLLDMDPQANLTMSLGYDPTDTTKLATTIYDVLLRPEEGLGAALIDTEWGVDLVPASLTLAGIELAFANRIGRELALQQALLAQRHHYDYILIDTPPSLGLSTILSLVAADSVLVPLQAHALALRALPQLEETIRLTHALNPQLAISGVLLTMVDRRTVLSQMVEEEARDRYGATVFQTVIPLTIKLAEAPAVGQPIQAYAPESTAMLAYKQLTEEILTRYGS